jgi:VWFA-related protein
MLIDRAKIAASMVAILVLVGAAKQSLSQTDELPGPSCFDVIVTDRDGRRIAGLGRDDFRLSTNGRDVLLSGVSSNRIPVTLAILLDTSGSTAAVLKDMRKRAAELVSLLGPEDQAIILSADVDVRTLQRLTSDKKKMISGINKAALAEPPPPEAVPTPVPNNLPVPLTDRIGTGRPLTTSNLRDALNQIITRHLASVKGVKAAVILSDGMITGRSDAMEFLQMLKESEVRIYPVFYQTIDPRPYLIQLNVIDKGTGEVSSEQFFRYWPPAAGMRLMADYTGGRIVAASQGDMTPYWKRVLDELTVNYRLSTVSPGPLNVSVNRPGVVTQVRGPLPQSAPCHH